MQFKLERQCNTVRNGITILRQSMTTTMMMIMMMTTTLYLPMFQKKWSCLFILFYLVKSKEKERDNLCIHTAEILVKSSWLYIYYTHVHAREHYTCTVHNSNVINTHSYCTITPFYTIIRITWSTFSLYMYMCLFRSTIINLNRSLIRLIRHIYCSTIFHSQKLYINGLIDPR